jgi:hypothetical protein
MPKRDLLDDELDEQPTIKVNEQYARRFEVCMAAFSFL